MSAKIFLSHASSETEQATRVASLLSATGLEPVIDADDVRPGDSFISFMNCAVADCDYCLLLWSRAASRGRWVREEWQTAYHRSVEKNQSFLVIGRLEELDPPPILRPRSWIELFPKLEPGIEKLVAMWRDDEAAAASSKRPVRPPRRPVPASTLGKSIYVTSKVFGKTFPFEVDLEAPVGVVTESVIEYLGAPRQLDYEGRMGSRYDYSLSNGRQTLDPVRSLKSQNVTEKSLLWLQVKITPFAAGESVAGEVAGATFRGRPDDATRDAHAALLAWSHELGLGY